MPDPRPSEPSPSRDRAPAPAAEAEGERRRRGLLGSVIGRVAPTVIDNVDMDQVVDAIDVNEVAQRLDLAALIDRLDVNQIADRLDLNALVDRLDVDAVAARLDLDALIDRLDVDALATRIDLDALVDRLDIDAVAARIDLNALIERINMAQLTAGASQEFAQSGLDLARRQVIRADATVEAFVDRTVRRRAGPRPDAPPGVLTTEVIEAAGIQPAPSIGAPRRRNVSGHYAGPVSRLLAVAADFAGSFAVYGFLATAVTYFVGLLTGGDVTVEAPGPVAATLAGLWLVVWLAAPVALFGRTPAMALVGLAVLGRAGALVGTGRAVVRAVVEPVSAALGLIGFAGVFVGRERRALHDVAAGTIVVYDWGMREAQRPVTVRELLSARIRRVGPGGDGRDRTGDAASR